jgi:hypothetical protein
MQAGQLRLDVVQHGGDARFDVHKLKIVKRGPRIKFSRSRE